MSVALLAVPAHCSRAPKPSLSLRRAHQASRRVGTAAGGVARRSATTCQLELPGLPDEVLAEAAVRFPGRSRESRLLVQMASRREVLLCPQDDALVARRARETHTLEIGRASCRERVSLNV